VAGDELSQRRSKIASQLRPQRLDCLIVTAAPNVRYLSGFTGSNGALLIGDSGALLFTDPRYEIQAAEESDCRVRVVRGPLLRKVLDAIRRKRFRRIGFERGRASFGEYATLHEGLDLGSTLEPADGWVERLRMVKSPGEIEALRRSAHTNSRAFERAVRRIRQGMTESDLAAEIEYQMRRLGAQKPAFETIVASGARTALPHAQPTSEPIRPNRLLLVDMGASRDGYASDMTRMLYTGRPGRSVKELYRAVLEAQLAGIAAVRPGVRAGDVDRRVRRELRASGLDRAFSHSTGHGLGLEIHEAPRLGRKDKTRLEAGMVITVEPGVYMEGSGGIRIEDTVVVTAGGCEVLTPTPKKLLEI
jgi:Xaa-Pro aminopeptidase